MIEIDFIDRLKSNGDLPPRVPLPIHLIPRKIPKEIQNLAAALILMGRAVRKKSFANKSDVLCRPLGNATKKKKKKNAESLGYIGKLAHGFKFWEASLMTVRFGKVTLWHYVMAISLYYVMVSSWNYVIVTRNV